MTHNKKNHANPLSAIPLSVPVPSTVPGPSLPEATVSLAPAAAAKLSADASEKAAAAMAAENALPGWQSLGKDHKPTHANGKQGRREKKVRW
jgi:hypothetical protein